MKWLRGRWLLVLAMGAVTACGQATVEEGGEGDDVEAVTPGLTESAVYDESLWREAPDAVRPESAHPYANNSSLAFEIDTPRCAEAVRVRFSSVALRSGDSLSLYDATGRRVQRITGYRSNFYRNAVNGTLVRMVLRSNRSGRDYGFQVDRVDIVEGPVPCPRIAWRMCSPGDVTLVQPPRALCGCDMPPQCAPLADFAASYGAGGGFTGGYQGRLVRGTGEIVRVSTMTAGDPEEQSVIAFASLNRLRTLANEVQASGFLTTSQVNEPANMTATFSARQAEAHNSASWPAGTTPASVETLITAFNKAVTCGEDPDDAVCAAGLKCVEGNCVAPDCYCRMMYLPVCSTNDNTLSNTCTAACAGEAVRHEGVCGVAGDACGGLRNLQCVDGYRCDFEGQAEASYSGQQGVCVAATPSCACAEIFQPVCGVDDVTYENSCTAQCRQIGIAHDGACGMAGDPCGGPASLTCQSGFHCEPTAGRSDGMGVCAEDVSCICTREYDPQCGVNGTTYGNPCTAGCAGVEIRHAGECGIEGDNCGTIRGLVCAEGFQCRYGESQYEAPYPDAGGACVPSGWCDAPSECGMNVRLSCPATWFCESHQCRYECNTVERWETEYARFETAHPYANDQRKGWTATGPEGTQAIRFVFESFETEQSYDFVTLYDEGWNEVYRYSGALGAFTSVAVPGGVAHVVFSSDESIVKTGFVGVAVEYKLP